MAASGSVSVKTRIASVVIAIASLFGCQFVAGDFDIAKREKEATGFCKSGEYRCNGEFLLKCAPDQSDWMLEQICPTSDLCDSKLEQCRVCTIGDQRCDGASRQECNDDGSKWTEVGMCESAAMCNPTFCGSCTPGEVACRGSAETVDRELWRCGTDGAWSEKIDTCNTVGICTVSLDMARSDPAWSGRCAKTECEVPGKYECLGNELRRCRQDLTGWDVVDTCATPEVCAEGVKNAEQTQGVVDMCPAGCLSAGMTVCDGQYLKRCRDNLTGYDIAMDPCPEGTDCNPVEGACTDPCTEGEVQCNGPQLRRCRGDHTWEELAMCASPVLCIITNYDGERAISGECVPPQCPMAGEYKCEGAALYECRQDLSSWDTIATCFSAELCSDLDKRCNTPTCQPDELRCFGNELRRCSTGLTGWDMVDTCETGEFCSNDPADPGCKLECPSATRCNGTELERCTPNGWVHQATCSTNDLCSCTLNDSCTLGLAADGCGNSVCGGSMAGYQCTGATLQRCQAGRNGWETAAECDSAALCYPGASPMFQMGYCATCPTAGEVRCATVGSGTRLETCAPDRKTWNASMTCGSQGCIDAGSMDYCAICNAGQVRCSAAILQRCGTDRRSWIEQTCPSAALCDATNNQCDICTPNSNRCDTSVLHHCSSDGQQDQTQTCANYCDATMGECDACIPGTSRCVDNVLYTCNANGQGETTTTCATAALCDAPNDRCITPTCAVGQKRCSGNLPQQCNSNRNGWESAGTACATAALCVNATATCIAPTCNVGQRQCNAGQPEQCNTDRNGWTPVGSACATPQLCTGMGVCNMPVCAVNQIQCAGAQPQRCNAGRTGWDNIGTSPCATTALCNADGTCTPPTCAPNQTQCVGNQPQICKGDRTGYQNVPNLTCATAELCVAASGTCMTPVCDAGATRCNGRQPERCNAGRTAWEPVGMPCATNALCSMTTHTCIAPTCQPGQFFCNNAQPQRCNSDQNGWVNNGSACSSAGLCDATTGTCRACTPGETRCNGVQPEQCNAQQTAWNPMGSPCATAALCDPTEHTCITPTCTPNQRQCMGNQPQLCNANQNGWDSGGTACATVQLCNTSGPMIGTCSSPTCAVNEELCVDGQPQVCNSGRTAFVSDGPTCASQPLCIANAVAQDARCTPPTCAAGEHQCAGMGGAVLQVCNSTFNGWTMLDTCASAGLCQLSLPSMNTCEPPRCAANQWQCAGNSGNLQQCRPDLTGFMTVMMCGTGEICDAVGHECDQCMSGDMQCAAPEVLQSCSTAGHWMDLEDCAARDPVGTWVCDETVMMCVEPPPTP